MIGRYGACVLHKGMDKCNETSRERAICWFASREAHEKGLFLGEITRAPLKDTMSALGDGMHGQPQQHQRERRSDKKTTRRLQAGLRAAQLVKQSSVQYTIGSDLKKVCMFERPLEHQQWAIQISINESTMRT